ncbi:MAG: glycosyltransferase [Ilumatobacteraceae bacterium]
MRVLTTLNYYVPHWTGLTMYAANIAEGLAERGHAVTVIASRHDRSLPRREQIRGVSVVRLRVVGRLSRTMLMPGYVVAMWREVGRHDVVHVHSPSPEAAMAVAIGRLRKRRTVITHQGDVVMPTGALNHVVQGAMNGVLGIATRLADVVITHNDDYAQHSRLLAPVRDTTVGVFPPTRIPAPHPDEVARLRTELGLDGTFVVGFAGRFVEEKGFDVLLAAVPSIRERAPHLRFVFAGDTDVAYEDFHARCAADLELHRDVVTSIGLIRDRQRLADFYAMCDVFVLPSRTDCFAAVQVEALLCGTPLITADIPGARSVVAATGDGVLVSTENPQALADVIVRSATHPLPIPSRERIAAIFDAEASISRYESLLERPLLEPPMIEVPGPDLTAADRSAVERMIVNESDMAYRRRVPTMMAWMDLHDGDVVLDCGCGMGYLSKIMASLRDITVVGVDGDIERLQWAAREQVDSVRANSAIEHLPFPDATFDTVLLSEVLEHVDDEATALAEIRRVLKPGGRVCISVPHANYPFAWDPINKLLESFGLRPMQGPGPITGQWSNHHRLYLPADLRRAIERNGFTVEAIAEQTSHALLFSHVLVYTIGKNLIERGLLPERLRRASDRFASEGNDDSPRNPINLARRLLRRVDRRNDAGPFGERHFVSLLALARRD